MVINEERFVWYALQSVLPFVDKIMVWDTGSSDRTVELIHSIKSDKIEFKEVGLVDAYSHTQTRVNMLAVTDKKKFDWLLILDGDEIWPQDQLKETLKHLAETKANTIVVHTRNLVGDIYHQLPESAGRYTIAGQTGNLAVRIINLHAGDLTISRPHGGQSYALDGIPVQDQPKDKIDILTNYYFHTTHLQRSPLDATTLKRSFKRKFELGITVPKRDLPGIFFNHPDYVPDVTRPMDISTYIKSLILTIPRRIKRFLIKGKSGY